MSKVIAVANQKGGVSKTTSTLNIGIGLARKGKKVLLIDADPQGSLTASLGFGEPDQIEDALPKVLTKISQDEEIDKGMGLLKHDENVTLMPCNIELSAFEVTMTSMMRREYILKDYVDMVRDNYDYILLYIMNRIGVGT